MSDEYLWDRTGPPDPEVARLERLLGTLRAPAPASPPALTPSEALPLRPGALETETFGPGPLGTGPFAAGPFATVTPSPAGLAPRPRPSAAAVRFLAPFAIAATLATAAGVTWLAASSSSRGPRPAWDVARLDGTPTIATREMGDDGRLPVGGWLETDAAARARIKVADIGRVDVEPRSRVGLVSTRAGNYRLQLARGTMHALIWAPPGQFFVDTPSSTAVDLGCAYTLTVNDDGAGVVEVTSGWVGFEWKGRESFIPAGAVCATRPGIGPGTPHYADATPALQQALETLDFRRVGPAARREAIARVLAEARERDAVTLWHLLTRVDGGDRDRVFDRLAAFVPPPPGVTRAGIEAGRRDMLDRWWDELGFGSMQLWRGWKQAWRDSEPATQEQ